MAATNWPTSNWPKGVPQDVDDYDYPLFNILDNTARDYPNQVYTIFNDATRTFAQVKDTADRLANFLSSHGIQKRRPGCHFFTESSSLPGHFFRYSQSRCCLRNLQPIIHAQ